MPKKKSGNMLGSWAFLVGVVLAIVLSIIGPISQTMTYVLIAIGLVVGLLNIKVEEVQPFLLSGIVLIIAASMGQGVISVVPMLESVLQALLLVFIPATIIVALKNVFSLSRR